MYLFRFVAHMVQNSFLDQRCDDHTYQRAPL
jgi:hypothetical protein